MTIADEIQRLDELRRNGALSPEEFATAKRRVLEGSDYSVRADKLEELMAQNELAQHDLKWKVEREKYMVVGPYWQRYIPSKVGSVVWGLFGVGFGVFWTMMAASNTKLSGGNAFFFPLFGVFWSLAVAVNFAWAFWKAGRYEEAQERYQRRRREILSKGREE